VGQQHLDATLVHAVREHVGQQHLDATLVHAVREDGYSLLPYTVNDSLQSLDLLKWGVDAPVTDQLDVITPNFV
jgi:glycerophosphoryl diester phosphodiesterase